MARKSNDSLLEALKVRDPVLDMGPLGGRILNSYSYG